MKTDTRIAFTASSTEFVELSEIERFPDDSGYVSTIRVGSGEFACAGKKFYFTDLPGFLRELKKSYEAVRGHAELRTQYEEEFVRFEFTSRGRVLVSGLVREYGNFDRMLRFGFEADQSFVPPLLTSIESVVVALK